VESVIATPEATARLAALVPAETRLFTASKRLVSELIGFDFHRGVLACGIRNRARSLRTVLDEFRPSLRVVAAAGVGNAENVGGIVRAAAAFGGDAVLLDAQCADPFSRRAIRVSVGNVFKLPVVQTGDFSAELQWLRYHKGCVLHAAVSGADARPLQDIAPTGRDVVVLGREDFGLREEILRLCDHSITIEMREDVDSLNVATAGAIMLYHFSLAPS